jgi:hypothetical protein
MLENAQNASIAITMATKKYCRKLKATQQIQNIQIVLADAASLAELLGNE